MILVFYYFVIANPRFCVAMFSEGTDSTRISDRGVFEIAIRIQPAALYLALFVYLALYQADMSLISDIKSFDSNALFFSAAVFVGLVVPGLLTLFFFERELLIKLDVLKTVLLSVSFTSPTFILLFTTTLIGERVFTKMRPETAGRFGGFKDWAITHSISNASIFFIAFLSHIAFGFTSKGFVALVLMLFVAFIAFEFWRIVGLAKGQSDPEFRDPPGG